MSSMVEWRGRRGVGECNPRADRYFSIRGARRRSWSLAAQDYLQNPHGLLLAGRMGATVDLQRARRFRLRERERLHRARIRS